MCMIFLFVLLYLHATEISTWLFPISMDVLITVKL